MNWQAVLLAILPFLVTIAVTEIAKLNPTVEAIPTAWRAVITTLIALLGGFFAGGDVAALLNGFLTALVQALFPITAAIRMRRAYRRGVAFKP